MSPQFIDRYRSAPGQGARRLFNAAQARAVDVFQDEMVSIIGQLYYLEPRRARRIYMAPKTADERLRLVADIIEDEISEYPIARKLIECIDELRSIARWADREFRDTQFIDAPFGDILYQADRCFEVYCKLRLLCGEPLPCQHEPASPSEMRDRLH